LALSKRKARLLDAVHETTGGGDDNVWVEEEALVLVLHVVATCDEDVGEVGLTGHLPEVECRLYCEFSGGRKNDSSGSHDIGVGLETLDERNDEGASLS